MSKIIITDCDHKDITIEKNVFEQAGVAYELKQVKTEQAVIDNCQDATVLCIQYAQISERVIESLPNLKLVVRYGIGYDTININAAKKHGVQACNIPDYSTNEVADHAVALTMTLARKVYLTNERIREGVWNFIETKPLKRLAETTVGVIGFGNIGQSYAHRMNAFGCKILAYDTRSINPPGYVSMVSLEEVLIQSDIISIHSPGGADKYLISTDELKKMKNTAMLINVSRGGIVDEEALDQALSNKTIAGAGFDVAKIEPMPKEHPLLKHKNFIISPHLAWYSEESEQELKHKVASEAVRFIKGEKLHYPLISF